MRGGEIELERKLMLPVLSLLTMPMATRIERGRFEQAQLRAAGEVLRIADETRRSFYAAVAARQSVAYLEQVSEAAQAGAELARRMAAAGNWSRLQQAREEAFQGDAAAQLERARRAQTAERERLARLLGLDDAQSAALAQRLLERLPDLPAAPREAADAEEQALANRLDLFAAQRDLSATADALGLFKATRFVNVLNAGYRRNGFNDGSRQSGYEIEFQLPLFDWGSARVARAETVYMRAFNRAAELAVNARSEARDAYAGYRSAYGLAKLYRDEVMPLKKRISDEQLLRHNGMLASVFELLAAARAQVLAVNAAIEAQRDFWMADSALQAALTGAGPARAELARDTNQKETKW